MTITVLLPVLAALADQFVCNGKRGLETTAMLLASDNDVVQRAVVPDQIATPWPLCRVEVTGAGKLELAAELGAGRYVARIHSHPREAFHSPTDDANPALNHPGALSIVAPDFGATLAQGLDDCAIYVRREQAWHPLAVGQVRSRYIQAAPANDE